MTPKTFINGVIGRQPLVDEPVMVIGTTRKTPQPPRKINSTKSFVETDIQPITEFEMNPIRCQFNVDVNLPPVQQTASCTHVFLSSSEKEDPGPLPPLSRDDEWGLSPEQNGQNDRPKPDDGQEQVFHSRQKHVVVHELLPVQHVVQMSICPSGRKMVCVVHAAMAADASPNSTHIRINPAMRRFILESPSHRSHWHRLEPPHPQRLCTAR